VASGLQTTVLGRPVARHQWALQARPCSATYDSWYAIYDPQRAIYKKIIKSAKKAVVNFV
jgi:hypothetical protein